MTDSSGTGPSAPGAATRRRLQVAGAALVAAFAVCVPLLLMRNTAGEWVGILLFLYTVLVAVLVAAAAGVLLAVGRTRPTASALGKGGLVGAVGGLLLSVALVIVFPAPPPGPTRAMAAPVGIQG